MGQLRFLLPHADRLSPQAIENAHICGRDRLPWITRITVADGQLIVNRDESESGTFHILWPLADREPLLLSTATLMERDEPYQLALELARGTLNRLRNLLADLQMAGMGPFDAVKPGLHQAMSCFVRAVAAQSDAAQLEEWSNKSIHAALVALDAVSAAMVERILEVRRRQGSKVVPLFVGRMGERVPEAVGTAFLTAFNATAIPFSWGRVESDEGRQRWALYDTQLQWCQNHNLRICGGPLLEFRRAALPAWVYLWEGDFENLLMVAGDYIKAVVTRYRGKVNFWSPVGRLVTGAALGLDEEQKLRLAVRAVEVIRAVDPQAPVIVSFDQPWAEYMSRQESDLPPLSFADTFVRSGLGVAGIGLEINLGTHRAATLPRDPLEFNLQLDRWSSLGLPLLISLAVPSDGNGFTPQRQQRWLDEYLPLLLARPTVQAIFWNQLLDTEADEFAHTGLVDLLGQPKPAFSTLANLRKRFSV
jgi:hypothetical protein